MTTTDTTPTFNCTLTDDLMATSTSIGVYLGIIGTTLVVGLTRTWSFYKVAMRSSNALHNNMYHSVIRAPIQFFDTNPKGNDYIISTETNNELLKTSTYNTSLDTVKQTRNFRAKIYRVYDT